jgi:hypothetical protein
MKTYRRYLLDQNSCVQAFRRIACADDDAAMTKAGNLLKQNPYQAAELWHRKRWVAQWQRGSDPRSALLVEP